MKNKLKATWLLVLYSIIIVSCHDNDIIEEDNDRSKSIVQFELPVKEIGEKGEEEIIRLILNKPALQDGVIDVKLDDAYYNAFTITPPAEDAVAKIRVNKGDREVLLKIKPIDDSQVNDNRIIHLRIQSVSAHFIIGTQKTIKVTVKDDESGFNKASIANFIEQEITLEETSSQGAVYRIHLSEPTASEGLLRIAVTSEKGLYNLHFVTEPASENGMLSLNIPSSTSVAEFRVKPTSNTEITGEIKIDFTIKETTGSIVKGNKLNQRLTILDDELLKMPKGYEITAGSTIVKKFYEYDQQGRIARVNWENYTPYLSHGTDTYEYDASSRLVRINKSPGRHTLYQWSNDKIVKSENVVDDVIEHYTVYEYDLYGNINGVATYHLQNDGTFKPDLFTIYYYFLDGNIYKSQTYAAGTSVEEPVLISTRMYESYTQVENLFPMVEILPNVKSQQTLATKYRVEESGQDLTYDLQYEFRPDGLPEKRIATSRSDVQTAVYYYY